MTAPGPAFTSLLLSISIGAAAFALAYLFHYQAKRLERKFISHVMPIDYQSGRTFLLLSIYEKPRRLLHSYFFTLLIWIGALLTPLLFAFLAFSMLPSIGAISFLVAILGINLLASREGFEFYGLSREILAKRVDAIGAGDMNLVRKIIKSLRKSTRYFLLIGFICTLAGPVLFFLLNL